MNRYTKKQRGLVALSIVGFVAWAAGFHVMFYRRQGIPMLQIDNPKDGD